MRTIPLFLKTGKTILTSHQIIKSQIHCKNLQKAFHAIAPQIEILSLDCFDTLLWRKTASPIDHFFELQHQPVFKESGMTALLRSTNEKKARSLKYLQTGSIEVTLRDIYQFALPALPNEKIQQIIDEELQTEIETCFAFPPIVELIHSAYHLNKKIIIVSDTYYEKPQLQKLLASKLAPDTLQMIDAIFCSSEFGKSKAMGLFEKVTQAMQSNNILHIGDNPTADLEAPTAMQIHALQLTHADDTLQQLQRMQIAAGCIADTNIRTQRAFTNPYRGLFALNEFEQPQKIIGHVSLGPILYSFAKYIETERNKHNRCKIAFLMRDGFLISEVCNKLFGEDFGTPLRISRFASYAASFRSKEDIDLYLTETIYSKRFADICRQLLLPETISESIIAETTNTENPVLAFTQQIHREDILTIIIKQSAAYRQRLIHYVKNQINLQAGDTLIFVDLGYRGTTQQKLAPIFADELNIKIIGRYLLALPLPNQQNIHEGLLDTKNCDDRTLSMLVNYIALFEQLNTANEKSVIDYDENGRPIFSDVELSAQQQTKLDCIQKECLQFINDIPFFLEAANLQLNPIELRDIAISELTRLIFFATEMEINYLKTFQFDFNLGTQKILTTYDVEQGIKDLRQRGLFFMERNANTMRTNYPAELRAINLELSYSLMFLERFKNEITIHDLSLRRERLPIIIISDGKSAQDEIEALPTFDGFFALSIPIGSGQFQIAIQFGLKYRWFELESVQLIQSSAYLKHNESQHTHDARTHIIPRQMTEKENRLFECLAKSSFIAFMPPSNLTENHILRVIFRPLIPPYKQALT